VRKLLGLEGTALGERYNRLVRERDLSAESLADADPKALVRASKGHGDRIAQFAEISGSQSALLGDAALLAPWEVLLTRIRCCATTIRGDRLGDV
jgi:hypothetical protein